MAVPIRVVVADHSSEARSLLRRRLEGDGGFVVLAEAQTGADAVRVVAELQPDEVVIDLRMEGLDGLDAIPMIRLTAPLTRIVAYPGETDIDLRSAALELGASAVVAKSAPQGRLEAQLHRLVEARSEQREQ